MNSSIHDEVLVCELLMAAPPMLAAAAASLVPPAATVVALAPRDHVVVLDLRANIVTKILLDFTPNRGLWVGQCCHDLV